MKEDSLLWGSISWDAPDRGSNARSYSESNDKNLL